MNILIVGAGKGSWAVRGQQLGAAIGARVTSSPTDADFEWCDLVVLIKKHATTFAPRAHRFGKPIVWDALDFWSQPAHNSYKQDAAKFALDSHIKIIKPALVIGATQAMADACGSAYLPHHSWAGRETLPSREMVSVVGYEGNPTYLGRWHGWLTEACSKRGWSFVVNPPNIFEADIIVSFRDGLWDGWICREWKSGVKAVNAIAADRPFISQDCAAVRELNPDGSVIESRDQLDDALDFWTAHDKRCATLPAMGAFTVEKIAADYLRILEKVVSPCTV